MTAWPPFPESPLAPDQWNRLQELSQTLTEPQARWISGYFAGFTAAIARGEGGLALAAPQLEQPDDLKRSIDEAARHADIGQLGLCPQCGFSTNLFGTAFTVDDERRKLDLLVAVGADIWG